MSRQLSIIIGAIGMAVAVILNRRRIADAAKRRVRGSAATDDPSLAHAPATPPAPSGGVMLDREPPPAAPAPRSSPGPAATSSPGPAPEDERPSQLTGPDPEATPVSAVSPAAATVQETQDDLMAGLREPVPDDQVEREVEAQLAASPLPADEVSVEVRDHIAQLEGTVPDPKAAVLIADEAAHVDGVQGLDNRLQPERETAPDEEPDAPRAEAPRDAEAARDPDEARRESE